MRFIRHSLLLIACALVQTSCETKRPPSVLMIAVDSLPFNLSLCSREEESLNSGFSTLCNESIRFTHAMTPSTLSVPALASVMTGLYPVDHGIRSNGSSGLSPRFHTFAEAAVRLNYRTAFFSGGAPVWRRTGLHQGFELFDDLMNFSSGLLFRPLNDSMELFKHWLRGEVGSDPFVAVLYAPDLSFTNRATENISGEPRSLSFDSQLEELDETFDDLIQFLKSGDRWNDTMIILVGLNGRETTSRAGEIEPVNLHSENSQVTLLIKPSQKPRDEGINWTIDRNVSLADLGRTLLEMFDRNLSEAPASPFPVTSLMSGLTSSQPSWPENRPVLIESGWGEWQGVSGMRSAVLKSQELVVFDFPPVLYNTLTDRFEILPLAASHVDPSMIASLKQKGFRNWTHLPGNFRRSFTIPSLLWLSGSRAKELHQSLKELSKEAFAHPRVLRWAAQSALEQKDWELLKTLGKKMNKPDWQAVADRNLGKKTALLDPCLSLFDKTHASLEETRRCTDELTLSLYSWMNARKRNDHETEIFKRRFQRSWEGAQTDLRILKANAGLGLIWLPLSAEEKIPSMTALALALPEAK